MTLKMKSTTNELWKGWNLAWCHHFTRIACAKSRDGYDKNWMHFVYKLDNLFRSIRVRTKTHLLQRQALHSFLNLFELQPILHSVCIIQRDAINFQHVLASFAVYQSFKIANYVTKGWKLMTWLWMVHAECKKVQSCNKLLKFWIAGVTNEFSSETLLRKRLSSLYTKCLQF